MTDNIEVVKLSESINIIEYKIDVLSNTINKLESKIDCFIEKQQCLEKNIVKINTTVAGITKFIWLLGGTVLGIAVKLLV